MSKNLALPGNPRYQPKELQDYFGYDNLYRTVGQVEIACLEVMAEMGLMPQTTLMLLNEDNRRAILDLTTTQIDSVERRVTKHDIRAWIHEAKREVPMELKGWLHVMLTSYDVLDTGRILQFVGAHRKVVSPACRKLLSIMASLTEKFAGQLQIGRTHGQHALPITVGFWLATVLRRMYYNFVKMEDNCNALVGKISGAVGAYNAQVGLGAIPQNGEETFEQRVLRKLGLEPAPISTQILPPEPLAYYLFSCVMMSGSIAQLGRDCRHLMRSEIAEVAEEFSDQQSGSSTMAHKRNPINFEQLEGTHTKTVAEFLKVLMTIISEHQRDLTGSSVARDFPTIIVNLATQLNTLLRENDQGVTFLQRMTVSREACQRNFGQNSNVILSEPLYIAIQMAGYSGDGHALVNHTLVPKAQLEGRLLAEVAAEHAQQEVAFGETWAKIPEEVIAMLYQPENYTGWAQQKALEVVEEVRKFLAA